MYEAIRRTRPALPANVPLIGFAALRLPRLVHRRRRRLKELHYTKQLMYNDRGAWHAMMSLISRALAKYLNAQVAAGAQAVQLFDSWVGCLSPGDYREYVLPHTRDVINGVTPGCRYCISAPHCGITSS